MDNSDDIFGPINPTSVRVYNTDYDLSIDNSSAPLQAVPGASGASGAPGASGASGAPGAPGAPGALATIFKN